MTATAAATTAPPPFPLGLPLSQRGREALAWSAGFFDGEGHTDLQRKKYLRIQIWQSSSPDLLRKFLFSVGGVGFITGPHERPSRPQLQPQWTFVAHGFEKVQVIVCMLWPWLGEAKRNQYRSALRKMMRGRG